MKQIAVIGSGTMGNGIAHVFAQHGYQITLVDIQDQALEKALSVISKNLDRQIKKELITKNDKQETLARISISTDISTGVSNADLVVEAAAEELDLKISIFQQLDEHAPPPCILASNTSSISITKIASAIAQINESPVMMVHGETIFQLLN